MSTGSASFQYQARAAPLLSFDPIVVGVGPLVDYPAQIAPSTTVPVASRPSYTSVVLPIPNVAPPTELIWDPHMPTSIPRTTLTWLTETDAPMPALILLAPFHWGPDMPSQVFARHMPTGEIPWSAPFTIGPIVGIGTEGSWRPQMPVRLDRLPPTRTGVVSYLTDPTILMDLLGCLVWTDTSLVQPDLSDALVQPAMTAEGLVQPTITSEGVC